MVLGPDPSFLLPELLASRLVRSFAALTDALNRHRGKGSQQVVRVEHVTVQAGGQAIVGAVTQGAEPERKRGSTPCTCPCTRARDAGPGPAATARAARRR